MRSLVERGEYKSFILTDQTRNNYDTIDTIYRLYTATVGLVQKKYIFLYKAFLRAERKKRKKNRSIPRKLSLKIT